MKVCMVVSVPLPPTEGIGHHALNLAQQLLKKGHEITLVTRGSWRGTIKTQINGIPVWKAAFAPLYPFHVQVHSIFVNRLISALEPTFDVVHLHTPLPPPVKTSLPLVTTFHSPMKVAWRAPIQDLWGVANKLQAPISCAIERRLIARSRVITTVAKWVAEALGEYGADVGSVFVGGNGVDHEHFTPPEEKKRKTTYILYTGRITKAKGLLELLDCAKIVSRRHPGVKFILAGTGPLEREIRLKTSQAGLDSTFELVGHIGQRDKIVQLYQDAMIYALPSHHEGLPTSVLEAMACGLPVVATEVGGLLEMITSGENGLLVAPHHSDRLAEAICQLLENRTLANRLGQAARQTIEERYTWDIISNNMLACYQRAIEA